jgi:hypothetical protein
VVRRFVRFIQPAPNPALKRSCAKSGAPLTSTLGVSVMEAQLSNQQRTIFDAVHHAVLVRYAA